MIEIIQTEHAKKSIGGIAGLAEPISDQLFPWLKIPSLVHDFPPWTCTSWFRTFAWQSRRSHLGAALMPLFGAPERTVVDPGGSGRSRSPLRARISPASLMEIGADTTAT
jgi:hypothetical protein